MSDDDIKDASEEWYVLMYERRYFVDVNTGKRVECVERHTYRSLPCRCQHTVHNELLEWIPDKTITRSKRGILARVKKFERGFRTWAQDSIEGTATGRCYPALLDLTKLVALRAEDATLAAEVRLVLPQIDPDKRFTFYEKVMETASKAAGESMTELSTAAEPKSRR